MNVDREFRFLCTAIAQHHGVAGEYPRSIERTRIPRNL